MIAIINFKAYESSIGVNAVKLAKICEKVSKKEKVQIAVAVQPTDILAVASSVKIPVLAQHVDAVEYGAKTGWILPEAALSAGASGSLVNHSEHRLKLDQIKATINKLRKLNMVSIACASTPTMAVKIAKLKPDIVAIEPLELIGTKTSISEARPEIITRTTNKIKNIPILCGAGVHSKTDVTKAIELGAQGVLLASAVYRSRNPERLLTNLVRGFKNGKKIR